MYTCGCFMLRYGRSQHNTGKQLCSIKNKYIIKYMQLTGVSEVQPSFKSLASPWGSSCKRISNLTLVLWGKWGQQTIRLSGLAPKPPLAACTSFRAPSSLLLVVCCFQVLKTSCPFTSTEMHFLHVLDCVELLEWGDFQSISSNLAFDPKDPQWLI